MNDKKKLNTKPRNKSSLDNPSNLKQAELFSKQEFKLKNSESKDKMNINLPILELDIENQSKLLIFKI